MQIKKFIIFASIFTMVACARYQTPPRETWAEHLAGASFMEMTETGRIAKKPIFQGAGGRLIPEIVKTQPNMDYGDKVLNDSALYLDYMTKMEKELYDALRKPGTSVQRAGTDIVVLMVRDAIMELRIPDISKTGDENLGLLAKILKKYDGTFLEVAGYTDSMRDTHAAMALSLDMAQRVAVYLATHGVPPTRMFIVGRGAARPIAAQDEMGRLTNRRVEIRITPVR